MSFMINRKTVRSETAQFFDVMLFAVCFHGCGNGG